MNNKNKLIKILVKLGYHVDSETDIEAFMRRKATTLYNTSVEFKRFLDNETKYLPKVEILVRVRWQYYVQGYAEPKPCYVCNGPIIQNINHKYCCHDCSTKVSEGVKRGPKVDLIALRLQLLKDLKAKAPEFKLVKFGHKRSTFKHICGSTIERNNYRLVNNPVCECQHTRIMVHTLDTLRAKYENTNWKPIRKIEGRLVKFKNKECGHYQTFSFDSKNPVCCTCHKKYAHNIVTHEEYCKKLENEKPEYEVVSGTYKSVQHKLFYKHNVCGTVFETTPDKMRTSKCCPHCYTCSYTTHFIKGVEFRTQGREGDAIRWIVNNTRVKVSEIRKTNVPKFKYKQASNSRNRTYTPDLYIENKNIIVEVKDVNSSGLSGYLYYDVKAVNLWRTLQRKARAVLAAGYRFNLIVFEGDTKLKLPKNWLDLKYSEIREWYVNRVI